MQNKNLRKALAVSMAIAMTGGLLAGCGNSSSGGSSNSGTTNSGSTSSASGELDTSEFVELSMYVISDRPSGQDEIDENLNKLLKEKLNCSLKINWIGWAEYANKYPLLFSSGEEFDMAYSASWLNFASLAQKGAFKSLDELWPTYAPKNFAAQSEEAKQQATVNGSYYCVPSLLSTYNTYGPFWRGDLVEGTDWDGKMETFEDIEEYCDIIKETHPEMECIDLYSTAPRWNEKGFYSKSALSDTDSTKFQNGKAALKIHNIDSYVGQAILHPENDIHYTNMVKDVAHLPYTQDCMVISNTSKHPERAMALWDLITNDQEVYDAFYYGIEGTSYELNDQGQFKILDTDKYGTNAMWSARSDALNRQQQGTPDDYQTNVDAFEEHIVSGQGNEKFTGFVLDTSSFETQLAACNNVQQQYWWPLELGYTEAESGLADYQSQMEAAGIETMKEAAQKQLDDYIASLK